MPYCIRYVRAMPLFGSSNSYRIIKSKTKSNVRKNVNLLSTKSLQDSLFLDYARAFDKLQPSPEVASLRGAGVIRSRSAISRSIYQLFYCLWDRPLSDIHSLTLGLIVAFLGLGAFICRLPLCGSCTGMTSFVMSRINCMHTYPSFPDPTTGLNTRQPLPMPGLERLRHLQGYCRSGTNDKL